MIPEIIHQQVRTADDLLGISKDELRDMLILIRHAEITGIPGAVIELGCAQGITTTHFRRFLNTLGSDKELHVCDSFEGLPAKRPEDGDNPEFHQGMFSMGPDVLLGNFANRGLEHPIIHTGWFGSITDYPDEIAFAFLDGDFYDSIMDGLNVLWPRMSSGASIAIHDYEHGDFPGARRATDEFAKLHGVEVNRSLCIPVLIKP